MTASLMLMIVVALFILAAASLIYYALRSKGDVRAELSHGSTVFKLEANDRSGRRRRS
jgi:flagellar basal body-associated protein FliL